MTTEERARELGLEPLAELRGFHNVGVVVQSYLYRTEADVAALEEEIDRAMRRKQR